MWTEILERQKLVEIAYQKGNELNLNNVHYHNWISTFFTKEYINDVGSVDITSEALLTNNRSRTAFLKAKAPGVVAGIEEICWFLRKHHLKVKICYNDGENISNGDTILEIYGKQKLILSTERIVLNVLQRMSGVATETKYLVDLIKEYPTRIAATRKTFLRYIDKKAVFLGGGLTHRFGLWDSILIKDNHLETLKNEGITDYVETAIIKASIFTKQVSFIEIEVTSHEEAICAAKKFYDLRLKTPCIIMLDNMTPPTIEHILETLRKEYLYNSVLLEASGDIQAENIEEYAKTGIDVVSLGYLTHSARVLNMSMEMRL
jgi:nicotinate-nucleotide pyrophosphorylase (carboxylating)